MWHFIASVVLLAVGFGGGYAYRSYQVPTRQKDTTSTGSNVPSEEQHTNVSTAETNNLREALKKSNCVTRDGDKVSSRAESLKQTVSNKLCHSPSAETKQVDIADDSDNEEAPTFRGP